MYDFFAGTFVWIAFTIFIFGSIFQIVRFFKFTKIVNDSKTGVDKKLYPIKKKTLLIKIKGTILDTNVVMALLSFFFHILIISIPIVLIAHNVMLDQAFGISFFTLPEQLTDMFTVIIILMLFFFLLRRLFYKRVRAISSISDFIILFIIFTPFVSGFIAYHQIFNYKITIMTHIISAELLLIVLPFSKLVHMLFFFLNRIFINSEYSFRKGRRIW